jgi:hypothetical protein
MNEHKSSYLFNLVDQCGINLNKRHPIDDNLLFIFRSKYIEWAKQRDKSLLQYLDSTPKCFRVFMPYSQRTILLSFRIAWYFDEIVIGDPLSYLSGFPRDYFKGKGDDLWGYLHNLWINKELIDAGYILYATGDVFNNRSLKIPDVVNQIALDNELKDALRKSAYYGVDIRPDSNGFPCKIYQTSLDVGRLFTFEIDKRNKKGELFNLPSIHIEEYLPRINFDELPDSQKIHLEKSIEDLNKKEILRTINSLLKAVKLGAAVLYDREVDSLIIKKSGIYFDNQNKQKIINTFNLTLPYVENLDHKLLLELRQNIPQAFNEFRAILLELISKIKLEGLNDQGEIKEIINQKILSYIRPLESEMKAAVKKANILSTAFPITSLGVLAGIFLGVPPAALLPIELAGIYGLVKTIADQNAIKEKLKGNPFYFLWKVKQ